MVKNGGALGAGGQDSGARSRRRETASVPVYTNATTAGSNNSSSRPVERQRRGRASPCSVAYPSLSLPLRALLGWLDEGRPPIAHLARVSLLPAVLVFAVQRQ